MFIRRLLIPLAVGVTEIGLRIVHAYVHGHGFCAWHACRSHGGDVCSFRTSTRTRISRDCQLHEQQAHQSTQHRDKAGSIVAGHRDVKFRLLTRFSFLSSENDQCFNEATGQRLCPY